MVIAEIDHEVLATRDEPQCVDLCTQALGMRFERYSEGCVAPWFAKQARNAHFPNVDASRKGEVPAAASLDPCFIASVLLPAVEDRLRDRDLPIIARAVLRACGFGRVRSLCAKDPDGNLIEIAKSGSG